MHRLDRIAIAASIMLMASSCASSGPQFAAEAAIPDGKALIYVYRPWSARSLFDVDWPIAIDGNKVGAIANGEYLTAIVAPGLHSVGLAPFESVLLQDAQSVPVDVNVAAGESRYVEGVYDQSQMTGTCCTKFTFVSVEERDALKEISGTKRSAR